MRFFVLLLIAILASCTDKNLDNPIDPRGENLPSAPTSLDLEPVNGKRAVLVKFTHNWQETDGVLIQRRLVEDTLWTTMDTVREGREYRDSLGIDFESEYEYQLRAINENGLSKPSSVKSILTSDIPDYNFSADSVTGFRTVKLAFHYDYSQGDTLWIERSAPGDEYGLTVAKLFRGEQVFTDTLGLRFGEELLYRLGGYHGKNGLVWSDSQAVTVSSVPNFNLRLSAVPNQRQMLLNFEYDYSQGSVLVIERDTTKEFKKPKTIHTLEYGNAYLDTSYLRFGVKYWWRLKGYARDSAWEYSEVVSLAVSGVPDYSLQAAPIPEQRKIRLTFAYPFGKSGDLLVQRASTQNASQWTTLDTLQGGFSFNDTTVSWDSLYWYRLSGYLGPTGREPGPAVSAQASKEPDYNQPKITMIFPTKNLEVIVGDTNLVFSIADASALDSVYVLFDGAKVEAVYNSTLKAYESNLHVTGGQGYKEYQVVAIDAATAHNRGTFSQSLQYIPTYGDKVIPQLTMQLLTKSLMIGDTHYVQDRQLDFQGTWSDVSGLSLLTLAGGNIAANKDGSWSGKASVANEGILEPVVLAAVDASYHQNTSSLEKKIIWSPTAFDRSKPENIHIAAPSVFVRSPVTLKIKAEDSTGIAGLTVNGADAAWDDFGKAWVVPDFEIDTSADGAQTDLKIIATDRSFWSNVDTLQTVISYMKVNNANDEEPPLLNVDEGDYECKVAQSELIVRDSTKKPFTLRLQGSLFDVSGIESFTINGKVVAVNPVSHLWSFTDTLSAYSRDYVFRAKDASYNGNEMSAKTIRVYNDFKNNYPKRLRVTANSGTSITMAWDVNTDPDFAGTYRIWKVRSGDPLVFTVAPTAEVSTNTYTFSTVSGVSYLVAVATVDKFGKTAPYVIYTDANLYDLRDGKSYSYITYGGISWMSQNLNYGVVSTIRLKGDGQVDISCIENASPTTCTSAGALYTWMEAMNVPLVCEYTNCAFDTYHQGACPDGWHVPTHGEWSTLATGLGGVSVAGTKLKSQTGWASNSGTNTIHFNAKPISTDLKDGWFISTWSGTNSDNSTCVTNPSCTIFKTLETSSASLANYYVYKASKQAALRCVRDF